LGLGVYFMTPDHDKFGIDFLGGVTLTVRTEAPHGVSEIRSRVRAIPGTIGETSEVKAILASGSKEEGFNQFRVTFKADQIMGEGGENPDRLMELVQGEVRDALRDILERGPWEVTVNEGAASGRLYFHAPHPIEDLRGAMAEIPIDEVQVTKVAGPLAAYAFEGKVGLDKTQLVLGPLIQSRFEGRLDSTDLAYEWAEPIPETSTVGAAVVAELRDKAFLAILVSLFFVVMYIRVRFAEYSYSFAAVVALVHDVLIALGVLSLVTHLDNDFGVTIVDAQINLPMIAAFLTIIGYSLNDTIVIFDRVRENLPRMKGSMTEIVDISINQTLSRTLLTSGTTLLTLLILLGFNIGSRNVLESFSFTLAIGIVVGTYSTIYIASPVLIFLEQKRLTRLPPSGEGAARVSKPKAQPSTP
jgi:preprotein translocase SecF subunit